jgi:hypothetical protein
VSTVHEEEAPELPAPAPGDQASIMIPGGPGAPKDDNGKYKDIVLPIGATRESEARFKEVKDVNPVTYTELEHVFNESYRELKRHLATISYQVVMADKAVRQAKSTFLLDSYPALIKDRPKNENNADMRDAYLMRDKDYLEAMDRHAQLKALESFMEGRIKTVENVCRYMRKRMDLIIRSGLSGSNLYLTGGKK